MLGTSDAWSTSRSSQWPSDPAYYIEDCQIYALLRQWPISFLLQQVKRNSPAVANKKFVNIGPKWCALLPFQKFCSHKTHKSLPWSVLSQKFKGDIIDGPDCKTCRQWREKKKLFQVILYAAVDWLKFKLFVVTSKPHKVHIFWESHKNLKKSPNSNWHTKRAVLKK